MRWRMNNPDAEVVPAELLPDSAVPLSQLGDEQGEALALFFASLPESERPTYGFSSPFKRTTQTGAFALSKLPTKIELVLDERLREIDFGIFVDLTKKGRAAKFPTQWQERRTVGKVHYRPEGGENWHESRAFSRLPERAHQRSATISGGLDQHSRNCRQRRPMAMGWRRS
jgi:broad specificity phosphatase PhoE